jgi:hypothetical protein
MLSPLSEAIRFPEEESAIEACHHVVVCSKKSLRVGVNEMPDPKIPSRAVDVVRAVGVVV